MKTFRVLVLCDDSPRHADTILEHIRAFDLYSRNTVLTFNTVQAGSFALPNLEGFDVVILHYSLCILYETYLSDRLKTTLRTFSGLKVQFIQDDYRWVNSFIKLQLELGIDLLFTLCPKGEIRKVWGPLLDRGVTVVETLAGYVPAKLRSVSVLPIAERELHVAYRGRELPYWLGKLSQEKVDIARGFQARATAAGLKTDIGWRESDRIYGKTWIEFISSAKAVLGTESGASITDFDGSIEREVTEYINTAKPPPNFQEVFERVLYRHEGNVKMNVISPRIFEAVCLKTALVLFPGHYSGVLIPERHYLPLEKDFSNFDNVAHRLRDDSFLQMMADRAYEDIILTEKYSLKAFVGSVDETLSTTHRNRIAKRPRRGPTFDGVPYPNTLWILSRRLQFRWTSTVSRSRTVLQRFLVDRTTIQLVLAVVYRTLFDSANRAFAARLVFGRTRLPMKLRIKAIVQAARISEIRLGRVATPSGCDFLRADLRVEGDICVSYIGPKTNTDSMQAQTSDRSFDSALVALGQGTVSQIKWNKDSRVRSWPILLSPATGYRVGALEEVSRTYPDLVVQLFACLRNSAQPRSSNK